MLLISFAVSIAAVVQANHVTMGFVILNWVLLADALAIIVIGTFIWFFTLHERANFHEVWSLQTRDTRIAVQDMVCRSNNLSLRWTHISDSSSNVAGTSTPRIWLKLEARSALKRKLTSSTPLILVTQTWDTSSV
jgi:hypothetical protein